MEKQTKHKPAFSISWLSRWRWNVLDLIQICNRGNVPTYLFCEMDMSWVEHLRSELKKRGLKVTVTAILLKAIAIAQLRHPQARTALLPFGRAVTLENVKAGFTAEKYVQGQPVVYFGTIAEPHEKSIGEIAGELRQYAEKDVTEIPELKPQHRFAGVPWLLRRIILWFGLNFPSIRLNYLGATFGVSSLGKYGIKMIIPPCVTTSTFGVGAVESKPVVRGGEIVIRPILNIVLNFDHRVIDGAPAARFLNDVRLLLEGGLNDYLSQAEKVASDWAVSPNPVQIFNSLGMAIPEMELSKRVSVG